MYLVCTSRNSFKISQFDTIWPVNVASNKATNYTHANTHANYFTKIEIIIKYNGNRLTYKIKLFDVLGLCVCVCFGVGVKEFGVGVQQYACIAFVVLLVRFGRLTNAVRINKTYI